MSNLAYKRGYTMELKCMEDLRKEGYYPVRSAGSKGMIDIVGIDFNIIRLIQVKRIKAKGRAHAGYMRQDDNMCKFSQLEVPVNCRKELWVWKDDKRRWFKEELE